MKRRLLMKRLATSLAIAAFAVLEQACVTQLENAPHGKNIGLAANGDVDGYDYCGKVETCKGPVHRGGEVWCQRSKACTKLNCDCHLFVRKRGEAPKWKHEAGPNEKRDYEPSEYVYACWCVTEHVEEEDEDSSGDK